MLWCVGGEWMVVIGRQGGPFKAGKSDVNSEKEKEEMGTNEVVECRSRHLACHLPCPECSTA